MWQMKGQLLDGWYVETCMKIRFGCLHHNELFSGVYFCRFILWRFLFTHGTNVLVLQRKSTMNSTTSNDVINVKLNWGCFLFMFFSYFLVRNIDTRTVSIASQYTFPVWKCMLRMRICAHCSICHIWCFGINMTSIWNHCIFICCIYVMCFLTRPSALSIWLWSLIFFKYLPRQDSNDECILLAEMQHSQPHLTL